MRVRSRVAAVVINATGKDLEIARRAGGRIDALARCVRDPAILKTDMRNAWPEIDSACKGAHPCAVENQAIENQILLRRGRERDRVAGAPPPT